MSMAHVAPRYDEQAAKAQGWAVFLAPKGTRAGLKVQRIVPDDGSRPLLDYDSQAVALARHMGLPCDGEGRLGQ